MSADELKTLYALAKQSLADKDYTNAIELLKKILMEDENYRDASRLLAQTVKLSRQRWYSHPLLWGGLGLAALVGLGVWLVPRLGSPTNKPVPTPAATRPVPTPAATLPGTVTPAPTALARLAPSPTSTPISLSWKRISMAQEMPRDSITAIVIDPRDPEVIYIGTENAGIYKSIDGGTSWQPAQSGLGRAAVSTLIMDPRDPKILYAGTQLGGVYKTTDGGLTWQAMNAGIDFQGSEWVAIVVMDAQNSQHLFFTDSQAIFTTTNGGLFWQKVKDVQGNCPHNFIGLVSDPSDGNILYTADWGGGYGDNSCQGGVYKSTDNGVTWTITNFQSQSQETQWNGLWIEPTAGQTLYISSAGKLWVTNDQGETWTESNPNSACSALVFDPQDPKTAYCSSEEQIIKTIDGGIQWSKISNIPTGQPFSMVISPQDHNTLLWGTTGLYISTDGGKTWDQHGSGLGGSGWELKIAPTDSSVLYAQGLDTVLYLSKDEGHNWDNIGYGQSLSFDNVGGSLYTMNIGEYLAISRDEGTSWEQISLPATSSQAIAVHPIKSNRVYAMYTRNTPPYIYYSDDLGKTWLSSSGMQDINNTRLFFDHDQGNRVYAIGDVNFSRSNDGGITWEDCGGSAFHIWASLSDVRAVVDWRDGDRLFMATRGNGIVTSKDACQSWQLSNSGLGSLFVNTIAIDPNNPDTIYAGTDGGAYISTDSGQTWGVINDGLLGATVVYSIVVDKDSNVYASTPYGIFKLETK